MRASAQAKPHWFPRADAHVLRLFPATTPIVFDPHVLRAAARAGFLDCLEANLPGRIRISPTAERLIRSWLFSWPENPAHNAVNRPASPSAGYLADQHLAQKATSFLVEEYWCAPDRCGDNPSRQKKGKVDGYVKALAGQWDVLRCPDLVREAVVESLVMAIANSWLFVSHFDYVLDHTHQQPMPFGIHHLLGCLAREEKIDEAQAWQWHLDAIATGYIRRFRPGPALLPADRQDFADFVARAPNVTF